MPVKSRGAEHTTTRRQRRGGPSMNVPGKGKVTNPKGGTDPRSTKNFAEEGGKIFGERGGEKTYGK